MTHWSKKDKLRSGGYTMQGLEKKKPKKSSQELSDVTRQRLLERMQQRLAASATKADDVPAFDATPKSTMTNGKEQEIDDSITEVFEATATTSLDCETPIRHSNRKRRIGAESPKTTKTKRRDEDIGSDYELDEDEEPADESDRDYEEEFDGIQDDSGKSKDKNLEVSPMNRVPQKPTDNAKIENSNASQKSGTQKTNKPAPPSTSSSNNSSKPQKSDNFLSSCQAPKTQSVSLTENGEWNLVNCIKVLAWDSKTNSPQPDDIMEMNWKKVMKSKRRISTNSILRQAAEVDPGPQQDLFFLFAGLIKMTQTGRISESEAKVIQDDEMQKVFSRKATYNSNLLDDKEAEVQTPMGYDINLKRIMATFDIDDICSTNIDDFVQPYTLAFCYKMKSNDPFYLCYRYPSKNRGKYIKLRKRSIINLRSCIRKGLNLSDDEYEQLSNRIKQYSREIIVHFFENQRKHFNEENPTNGQKVIDDTLEDAKAEIDEDPDSDLDLQDPK